MNKVTFVSFYTNTGIYPKLIKLRKKFRKVFFELCNSTPRGHGFLGQELCYKGTVYENYAVTNTKE
jgi:hypothetical protein